LATLDKLKGGDGLSKADKAKMSKLLYKSIAKNIVKEGGNKNNIVANLQDTSSFLTDAISEETDATLKGYLTSAKADASLGTNVKNLVTTLETHIDNDIVKILYGAELISSQITKSINGKANNISNAEAIFTDSTIDLNRLKESSFDSLSREVETHVVTNALVIGAKMKEFGEMADKSLTGKSIYTENDKNKVVKLLMHYNSNGVVSLCLQSKTGTSDAEILGEEVKVNGDTKHKPVDASWKVLTKDTLLLDYSGTSKKVTLKEKSGAAITLVATDENDKYQTFTGKLGEISMPAYCEDVAWNSI
jgi:hypothetical protein